MFTVRTFSKKGFTLIELMVVIAVIAILATIALVGLSGVQKGARDTQRLATMNGIRTAMQRYNSNTGSYPAGPFYSMLATLTAGGYLPAISDPGCGSGATGFTSSATNTPDGSWTPCGSSVVPTYSYGVSGGVYTLVLVRESAGSATLLGPQ